MPIVTVGRLRIDQTKVNANGTERWIKGEVQLYGPCTKLLMEIGQRKLPFTIVTGDIIPKEPVVLVGEITTYPIPNANIIWKTLEVKKFITEQDPLLKEQNLTMQKAALKIANEDKDFLDSLGSKELKVRKQLTDLVGTKNRFADHMMELYGTNAYKELKENPWKMIHMVPYFTMQQADKVAEKLGIPLTDGRRFQEHFRYLLDQEFAKHRNTYMSKQDFEAFYWMHFSDEMDIESYKKLVDKKDTPVIKTDIGYHPAHFYFAEKASYEVVIRSLDYTLPTSDVEEEINNEVLEDGELTLTSEQEHAVRGAFHTPLHIITGGPGTGKTTVLRTILTKLMMLTGASPSDETAPFLLVAPTGKAAYRMWEQTGITAHTIHSAFGIIPEYGCLNVSETARRLSHIRYLVIDEASMLDTKLFGDMCQVMLAMDHIPFLLLVGDVDQLPPVQHGQVFRDLLDFLQKVSPEQVTLLTVLKRQAGGSSIPELASYIRKGQFPEQEWFQDKDDVFFVPVDMNGFSKTLMRQVLEPKKDILDEIQILTPYRNGGTPDTIHEINRLVEPLYNPPSMEDELSVTTGNPARTFRVGDKVINRTNRSKRVINGSIGTITAIHNYSRDMFTWTMDVDFDGYIENYIFADFKTLEHAYAITIHASQGSEYPNVVTAMLRGAANTEFLNRNLLYVAVTRASKRLVLMGQISAFQQAAVAKQSPRKTALSVWLRREVMEM